MPELKTTGDIGRQAPELYPKHLGAFYVCALAQRNEYAVEMSKVEKLVPHLVREGFNLQRFSYRESAGGPSSPAIRAFFEFMTDNGYLKKYNPTVVTDEGIQYCKQVVRDYRDRDPEGAVRLAKLFELDLDSVASPTR